ncbi:hypothetical protein [Catellatospora vulcania]|uniref:hypothetical protein n=1 Tax=Catellatospora vulcania TaxID=1460450 RepID=UPI0012D3D8F0|nr:hypothetical protein [Catellatospora vulcania]
MTIDAPAPEAAEQPQSTPPARRNLWRALVAAWALLLVGLAVWSARNDPPSLRDQTTVASAKATIEEIVGQVTAVVPAGSTIQDKGYAEKTCRLSAARDGVSVVRTLTVSGPVGNESATVEALAAALPDALTRPADGPKEGFYYDAGNYVAVHGKVTGEGTVAVDLSSGCRVP